MSYNPDLKAYKSAMGDFFLRAVVLFRGKIGLLGWAIPNVMPQKL
jgi:hypothetical protein